MQLQDNRTFIPKSGNFVDQGNGKGSFYFALDDGSFVVIGNIGHRMAALFFEELAQFSANIIRKKAWPD